MEALFDHANTRHRERRWNEHEGVRGRFRRDESVARRDDSRVLLEAQDDGRQLAIRKRERG
jgi:hypothetical protein